MKFTARARRFNDSLWVPMSALAAVGVALVFGVGWFAGLREWSEFVAIAGMVGVFGPAWGLIVVAASRYRPWLDTAFELFDDGTMTSKTILGVRNDVIAHVGSGHSTQFDVGLTRLNIRTTRGVGLTLKLDGAKLDEVREAARRAPLRAFPARLATAARRVGTAWVAVIASVIPAALAGVLSDSALGAFVAFLLSIGVMSRRWRRKQVIVGREALTLINGAQRQLVRYQDIAKMSESLLVLARGSESEQAVGLYVGLDALVPPAETVELCEAIRQRRDQFRLTDVREMLMSGDLKTTRARFEALLEESYRSAAIDLTELSRVVVDPGADRGARIRAAVGLKIAHEEVARVKVRVAIEETGDVELAEVFEAVLSDQERAIEGALK